MSINQDERPRFFEGQYLGAEDMTAAVEYGRIQQARHMLGGHTWGIAMGLQLREADSPWVGGNVDVYIQPGYAWDGFGRPVVVLAPYKLPADLFKDQYDGLVPVWLRYAETRTREPRAGFGVCSAEDQTMRVQETFEVEIGKLSHSEQHEKITVSDKTCDAMEVYKTLQSKDALICDESVPFQTFPDIGSQEGIVCKETDIYNTEPQNLKTSRWLIPLGYVRWNKGTNGGPGYFTKLFDPNGSEEDKKKKLPDLKASRSMRQYIGAVAENIYSADGVIRLRNREKNPPAQGSNSEVCEKDRLQVNDDATSRDMAIDNGKLSVTDLVWVEGNLRAKGDIKLFGKNIDFRNSDGSENDAPLRIQRAENNPGGGKDLQVVIGNKQEGKNRLAIGPLDGATPVAKVVIQDDGKVGINIAAPASPKNTLDVKGKAVIGANYAGASTAPDDGLLVEGNVGIKTAAPMNPLDIGGRAVIGANFAGSITAPANGLLVEGNVGIGTTNTNGSLTIRGGVQPQQGNLTLFSNDADFVYDGGNDNLFIFKNTSANGITAFAGSKVGIGTINPRNPLAIKGTGTWEELVSFEDVAGITKWHINQKPPNVTSGLNFSETGVADGRLFLQVGGNIGIGTIDPKGKLDVNGNIRIKGSPLFKLEEFSGISGAASTNTNYSSNEWIAIIAGFKIYDGHILTSNTNGDILYFYILEDNGQWKIQANFRTTGQQEKWDVWVLFIRKELFG